MIIPPDQDLSKISSYWMNILLKTSTIIHCHSSGPTLWFFNKSKLPNNVIESRSGSTSSIRIKKANHGNDGTYHCIGSYNNTPYLAYTKVTVIGKSFMVHFRH